MLEAVAGLALAVMGVMVRADLAAVVVLAALAALAAVALAVTVDQGTE